MKSQNFNVITAHAINSNVVLVHDQLAGSRDPACSAHTRMGLKLGQHIVRITHNIGRANRFVFDDLCGKLTSVCFLDARTEISPSGKCRASVI